MASYIPPRRDYQPLPRELATIGNYDHLPEDDRPFVGIHQPSTGQELYRSFRRELQGRRFCEMATGSELEKCGIEAFFKRYEEMKGR